MKSSIRTSYTMAACKGKITLRVRRVIVDVEYGRWTVNRLRSFDSNEMKCLWNKVQTMRSACQTSKAMKSKNHII